MKDIKVLVMLLALGLMGFTACSDSDDSGNDGGGTPPDEKRELTMEQLYQREVLASVLNQLTGESFSDTTDVNFEGRTFEAIIGQVFNHSRPSERTIRVRNANLAEGSFRSLAGGASDLIKETADGCVIDLTSLDCHSTGRKQSLGTLTFHRNGGADNAGYADIDIACIPGLQRISYKTADQWGDNAVYDSPIGEGEVLIGGGRYWICVRQAGGDNYELSGVLINIQPGKSDGWTYMYDEKWAAWGPSDHVLGGAFSSAILEYVELCGDPSFAGEKRRIMEKSYGSQVFPVGCVWNYNYDLGIWQLPEGHGSGFGATDPDDIKKYCHNGWWPYTHGVIIVRDVTEGDYRAWHGWWRRWHVYCTAVKRDSSQEKDRMGERSYEINSSGQLYNYTFHYTNISDFYSFPAYSMIYTARGVVFTNKIPAGFTKVDGEDKKK